MKVFFEFRKAGLFLAVIFVLSACTGSGSIRSQINDADARLRAGGLTSPSARAELQAAYDAALRRYEANPDKYTTDASFILPHAHFGLAMTRTWGLLEQLVDILDAGNFFESFFNISSVSKQNANCAILTSIGDIELVLQTLLETAIDPIIESLTIVAKYPEFHIDIKSAFFEMTMFRPDAGVQISGEYRQAEVLALLGAFQLASGAANWLFAYEELVPTLASFGLVNISTIDGNTAKFFNSNPCVGYQAGNPLLRSSFGLLRPDAVVKLSASRSSIGDGLANLASALQAMQIVDDNGQDNDLLSIDDCSGDYSGPPCGWGHNLAFVGGSDDSRFQNFDNDTLTAFTRTIESFVGSFSNSVDLRKLVTVVGDIQSSVVTGAFVDLRKVLVSLVPQLLNDPDAAVTSYLDTVDVPALSTLDLPALNLGVLFSNPPGDLKALFPLTYSHDEAFENLDNSDSVRTLKKEILNGSAFLEKSDDDQRTGDYVDPWIDRNCDGWWNQKGDFMMQREMDTWRDSENGNGVPDGSEVDKTPYKIGGSSGLYPGEIGIVGTFIDLNADGIPDRGYDSSITSGGAGSTDCSSGKYSLAFAGSSSDPVYDYPVTGRMDALGLPWGLPETDSTVDRLINSATGAMGYLETGNEGSEKLALGRWLGHYWPPRNPNDTNLKASRRDPSNGVFDRSYLFFPDPSMGGVFLHRETTGFSVQGWGNQHLNKLLSDLNSALGLLGTQ